RHGDGLGRAGPPADLLLEGADDGPGCDHSLLPAGPNEFFELPEGRESRPDDRHHLHVRSSLSLSSSTREGARQGPSGRALLRLVARCSDAPARTRSRGKNLSGVVTTIATLPSEAIAGSRLARQAHTLQS